MEQTNQRLEQVRDTLEQQGRLLHDLAQEDSQAVRPGAASASNAAGRENPENRFGGALQDRRWLLAQSADHYTLQLLTATNEAWLIDLLRRYPLPSDSAHFRTIEGGWYRYRVVTGAYKNPRDATQALEALPEPWQSYDPWVRKIGPIQETLLSAR